MIKLKYAVIKLWSIKVKVTGKSCPDKMQHTHTHKSTSWTEITCLVVMCFCHIAIATFLLYELPAESVSLFSLGQKPDQGGSGVSWALSHIRESKRQMY